MQEMFHKSAGTEMDKCLVGFSRLNLFYKSIVDTEI